MLVETRLNDNFEKYNFFQYSKTLYIIDDYNIMGMKEEALNFYSESFDKVGCHTIHIYFQVDSDKDVIFDYMINDLANACGINQEVFHSIYTVLHTNFHFNFNSKDNQVNSKEAFENAFISTLKKCLWKLNSAIKFIENMNILGIYVDLIPFSDSKIEPPPFHGRYWLSISDDKKDGNGYIVDASLNTFGKGRIFAQLMDKENFDLLKDFFYEAIETSKLNVRIGIEDLKSFKYNLQRILKYYRH